MVYYTINNSSDLKITPCHDASYGGGVMVCLTVALKNAGSIFYQLDDVPKLNQKPKKLSFDSLVKSIFSKQRKSNLNHFWQMRVWP